MGMYTEFVASMRLENVPDDAVNILQFMASGNPLHYQGELPKHPFFRCGRWTYLFSMHSCYFVPYSVAKFEYFAIGNYYVLIVRSDIKNYDNEIDEFISWVKPWMTDNNPDVVVGYKRYEEDNIPTLLMGSGEWRRIVATEPVP